MTIQQVDKLKIEGWENFKPAKGEWKNLFRGRGYPSSPNLWATSKQRNKIFFELTDKGIDVYTTIFLIGGQEKKLFDLSCGDCWNLIQSIRKHKINEFIK